MNSETDQSDILCSYSHNIRDCSTLVSIATQNQHAPTNIDSSKLEPEINSCTITLSSQNDSCIDVHDFVNTDPEAQNVSDVSVLNASSHSSMLQDNVSASTKEKRWFQKKGLNIMHLNIHYLYSKLDKLKILLSQTNEIDVICLCETFLNENFSNEEIKLENYQLFRRDRETNGGGLVVYVKENLRCLLRDDLQIDGIESLWLEVKHEAQKSFLLGYTYRPPSSNQRWMTEFEEVLEQVYTENKETIILGISI